MDVTIWDQDGSRALRLGESVPEHAVIWLHDDDETGDAEDIARVLETLGARVPLRLLNLLFDAERYPGVKYADEDEGARSVVAFEVSALEDYRLQLKFIEFLQYGRVLVSRTQPCLFVRGIHEEPWEGEPCEVDGLLLGVSRRWKDSASTSGDLGTIALYTLIKSLTDVRRKLHGWLGHWTGPGD